MRPDEFDDQESGHADDVLSGAEFTALEAELSAAGVRARRRASSAPDAAFAASLRARLLASAHVGGMSDQVAGRGDGAHDVSWAPSLSTGPVTHPVVPVRARVTARTPTILPAPRWTVLTAAAALIVAIVGLNANLLVPVPPSSRVTAAAGAELVRDGAATALAVGTELRSGDEVRVSAAGSANLLVGENRIRLSGGADLRLTRLEQARVEIEQVTGRAWHRVVLPSSASYVVTTGSVSWTAKGTAFDLDRTGAATAGGDVVRELSIQHAVVVAGVNLRVTIDEGNGATVRLSDGPTIETAGIDLGTAIADPWIRANAADDRSAGFQLGALDGFDFARATAGPAATGTPSPTASPAVSEMPPPEASPVPTSVPTSTPVPTAKPTPRPTAKPTPTPAPTMGTMSLAAVACPGGVTLDWTDPVLASFDHVRILRGTSSEIPAVYPPGAGVVAIDGGYTTVATTTSGYDVSSSTQSAWYRAVAFDAQDKAIAASVVTGVTTAGAGDLGVIGISGSTPGELAFSWAAFGGAAACFSYYKVVKSADDPSPSYLTGATAIAVIGDQAVTGTTVTGLPSGSTYWFRVEAIRTTALGKFVVAASTPVQYTVP